VPDIAPLAVLPAKTMLAGIDLDSDISGRARGPQRSAPWRGARHVQAEAGLWCGYMWCLAGNSTLARNSRTESRASR